MQKWVFSSLVFSVAILAGCRGGSNVVPSAAGDQSANQSIPSTRTMGANAIPKSYQCLPSGLKKTESADRNPSIAYADMCSVASAPEKANLQAMAISLAYGTPGKTYNSYCTGTPISYDPKTRIGFIVTAAHCVVGGAKPANTKLTPKDIVTFSGDTDQAEVFEGTPSKNVPAAQLTGAINAVYVPTRYCAAPAIRKDACVNLPKQNGDVAVLKVVVAKGSTLRLMPQLRLAPATLSIPMGSYLLALGYGANTSSRPASNVLYYINYQYFANNSYKGVSGQATIMNGYHPNANYYSIVCQGDSGGPDLYWDGANWDLVGAHSYGPNPCGTSGVGYNNHEDVSADVRLFTEWIDKIMTLDTAATGCKNIGPAYTCAAR
jgi:hypothetical protein